MPSRRQLRALLALAFGATCDGAQRSSQFATSFTSQLERLGDSKLSCVACLGPRNSGKGSLLGSVMGASVPDVDEGVVSAIDESSKVAVLNSAGFGERLGPGSASAEDSLRDTALAVALADVVVVNVFFREFASDPTDAVGSMAELRPALELILRMGRDAGAKAPAKRLVLVVRDFEPEEGLSEAAIGAEFSRLLDTAWASLAHVPGSRGLKASDLLRVQVAALPPARSEDFAAAVAGLKATLANAAGSGTTASAVEETLALALKAAAAGGGAEGPEGSPEDYAAASACARAASEAFDEYASASADLHRRALARDRREPLLSLGAEGSALLAGALRSYASRLGAHDGSDMADARRAYLRATVLADLRPLFSENVQLAVKQAVVEFAQAAANISTAAGTNFDAEIQAVVSGVAANFRAKADALRVPEAGEAWSAGLEERMLLQELQSMSSEMVRRAQLHGLYQPAPPRVPTGVALHWLHPNPFGKDMRNDALSGYDRLAYSDRAKELLRSSPMRLSPAPGGSDSKLTASPFSGGIKLTDEDLVLKDERRR